MRALTLALVGLAACAASAGMAEAQAGGAPAPAKPKKAAAAPAAASPAPAAPAPAAPAPAAPQSAPAALPAEPAPSAAPPAGAPAPEAVPGPAPAAPGPEAPPAPTPPPPPAYGPQRPPPPPPSGPYYGRLGQPEPEIEKGDWDPWEHPTADTHEHDGFYLRLAIGVGGGGLWGSNHALPNVDRVSLSGFGFGTSIAVGGTIAQNLQLNADLFQTTVFNPTVFRDGHRLGNASDLGPADDLGVGEDVSIAGIGLGVTYYFMPVNVYLALSLGLGQAVFEDFDGRRSGSDFGLGGNFMFGKEWWVGADWGIGVAGQLVMLFAHDEVLGGVNAAVFNVMFTATYN